MDTPDSDPSIPAILHQTWRTETPPDRWAHTVAATRAMHADWRYIMWSNERADSHVEQHHPELWPAFRNFERGIMRADVIRYVVLHDFGGLYCDLDYEFLRPYEFAGASLVLGMEFDVHHGDSFDQVSNFVMASAPQHPFWRDVLDDLIQRPPQTDNYHDVIKSTGPGLLTRVFFANRHRYRGVRVEPRPVFNPHRLRGRNERLILLNGGVAYGLHHAWGSWRERLSATYARTKLTKLFWGRKEQTDPNEELPKGQAA